MTYISQVNICTLHNNGGTFEGFDGQYSGLGKAIQSFHNFGVAYFNLWKLVIGHHNGDI